MSLEPGSAEREEAHARWQRLGRGDHVESVLDLARRVAQRAGSVLPVIRALTVEQVFVSPGPDGTLAVSRSGGVPFVHVFSSPVRLVASLSPEDSEVSMTTLFLADLVRGFGGQVGVRLDPATDAELTLEPDQVRQLVATAAGVVTPAALTAVEGEELRVTAGPEAVTDLDRAVVAALPEARVRRCVAALDGVGGRTWPVYLADGPGLEVLAILDLVEQAARRPTVVVVNGEPRWLAALLTSAQDVALDVTGA
ncbi:hypothetical protein KRR39_06770 [Nocardioides panacis]|uniref:SseB protein N-terminal domain-containing protein n=1 Tax=Nocardioides panacis TaxID=2849501 RepID=A0A975T0T3_9ACTN|nr:SseB family protein [Nocardioides panacis]QWZ09461.1 hypothetical protein KRR39_06770 [Nocardioides panacis]